MKKQTKEKKMDDLKSRSQENRKKRLARRQQLVVTITVSWHKEDYPDNTPFGLSVRQGYFVPPFHIL